MRMCEPKEKPGAKHSKEEEKSTRKKCTHVSVITIIVTTNYTVVN